MTDCPTLRFLTAVLAAQKPAQAKIVTCHGKDSPTPYGQAYHIKSNSLRIFDPHFGSAGCLNGLSSLLVGRTIAAQLRRSILHIGLLGK